MMKKVKLLFTILAIAISTSLFAQKTISSIEIKTSATIQKSKDIIEQALAVEKGVKSFKFKKTNGILVLSFRSDKTTANKIRTAINQAGFDADDTKAYPRAVKLLPKECQPKSSCASSCGTKKKKKKTTSCCSSKKNK